MHQKSKPSFFRKFVLCLTIGMLLFSTVTVTYVPQSKAQINCCSCTATAIAGAATGWLQLLGLGAVAIIVRTVLSRWIYINGLFWRNRVGFFLQQMGSFYTGLALYQTHIIGQFMDANQQMKAQQTIQLIRARAHKDYHPAIGLCEFSSNAKSLADSERRGEINQYTMAQRSIDRQVAAAYTMAAKGPGSDIEARIAQFKKTFCDPRDHHGGLRIFCGAGGPDQRLDKDIDYTRTVEWPFTLKTGLSDGALSDNEEEVLALGTNLYGFNAIPAFLPSELEETGDERFRNGQEQFMNMRAYIAKMSAAENSFNAITALKAEGAPGAREFLMTVFKELGFENEEEVALMLGGLDPEAEPSYYAQMEVLTKKLAQNPDFYVNLYDKPANVERQGVALQAVGLMQKFDLFKSHLRNETNLSLLLEMAIMKMQEEIENEINLQGSSGRPVAN